MSHNDIQRACRPRPGYDEDLEYTSACQTLGDLCEFQGGEIITAQEVTVNVDPTSCAETAADFARKFSYSDEMMGRLRRRAEMLRELAPPPVAPVPTPPQIEPSWSVLFALDSATPSDPATFNEAIDRFMVSLVEKVNQGAPANQKIVVSFVGETDTSGSDQYNKKLARQRYQTVVDAIREKIPALRSQLQTSFGIDFLAYDRGEEWAKKNGRRFVDDLQDPRYRRVGAFITTKDPPFAADWQFIDSIPAVSAAPPPRLWTGVIRDGVSICTMATGPTNGKEWIITPRDNGTTLIKRGTYATVLEYGDPVAMSDRDFDKLYPVWHRTAMNAGESPPSVDTLQQVLDEEIENARTTRGVFQRCIASNGGGYQGVDHVEIEIVLGNHSPEQQTFAADVKRRLEQRHMTFIREITVTTSPRDIDMKPNEIAVRVIPLFHDGVEKGMEEPFHWNAL